MPWGCPSLPTMSFITTPSKATAFSWCGSSPLPLPWKLISLHIPNLRFSKQDGVPEICKSFYMPPSSLSSWFPFWQRAVNKFYWARNFVALKENDNLCKANGKLKISWIVWMKLDESNGIKFVRFSRRYENKWNEIPHWLNNVYDRHILLAS